ncbi:MAG: hypothetical protein IT518_20450 [Burkholderiales bacterium]|nr:hypothetical protein [Burkholderiales bacterium]
MSIIVTANTSARAKGGCETLEAPRNCSARKTATTTQNCCLSHCFVIQRQFYRGVIHREVS